MRFSIAVLASVALLASSASAALIPKSPRTSVQGRAEYKRRQATSADIVRRKKEGPKRKRAGASPAVCAQTIGQNVLVNGNFQQSATTAPGWTKSAQQANTDWKLEQQDGYGGSPGTKSISTSFRAYNPFPAAAGTIQQSVTVCPDVPYKLQFDLGRGGLEPARQKCNTLVQLIGTGMTTQTLVNGLTCETTAECPNPNGTSDFTFGTFSFNVGSFSAETAANPVTVRYAISCPNVVTGGYTTSTYMWDNIFFARV